MAVPTLQAERGLVTTTPAEVFLAGAPVSRLRIGHLFTTPAEVFLAGRRSASMPGGIVLDNLTISNAGAQLSVPGYALRKGLRVMTLVNDKVMAFRNVID